MSIIRHAPGPDARREPLSSRIAFGLRSRRRRPVGTFVRAWWQAAELDRQLAAGTVPANTAVLALRAQRITAPRSRRRLAGGLAGVLRQAEGGNRGLTAAVRPQAGEVIAARAVLTALDQRLRAPEPITARGSAMIRALLTDVAGPLYQPAEPGVLGSRLRAAAAALEPGQR